MVPGITCLLPVLVPGTNVHAHHLMLPHAVTIHASVGLVGKGWPDQINRGLPGSSEINKSWARSTQGRGNDEIPKKTESTKRVPAYYHRMLR